MPHYDVIGLGVLRSDHIYSIKTIPVSGEHMVCPATVTSGGSAANTIFGLSKLGLKCGLIGAVGDDPSGRTLVAELLAAGIDTNHVASIPNAQTDSATVMFGADGGRVSYLCHDAGKSLCINEGAIETLNQTAAIHIGGLADPEQLKAISTAVTLLNPGISISLSIGDSEAVLGIKAFETVIARAAVVFASRTAVEKLTGKNYHRGGEICRRLGAKTTVIFLTCGEEIRKIRKKGKAASVTTYIRNHEYECTIESAIRKWPNIVETTGAQDAFAAGFLYGLLKGRAIDECGFLGDILAQACLKTPGARDSLPDAGEVSKRYFQIHREELSF